MKTFYISLIFCITGLLAACKAEPELGQPLSIKEQPKLSSFKRLSPQALNWAQLMPADYEPQSQTFPWMMADSERMMLETLEQTPVVEALNQTVVKVSGYVVPLAGDQTAITEFLLVPFLGACIHVPPPPANQIVYVKPRYPLLMEDSFEVVSVAGKLSTEGLASGYGAASYLMEDSYLIPFDKDEYAGIASSPVVVDDDGNIQGPEANERENSIRQKP